MDLYGEIILDHYKNPRHKGSLKNPDLSAEGQNPLCGDGIRIDIKINAKGKIEDIYFDGQGCAISQASASMLTEKILGKNKKDIQKLKNKDILQMLNIPLSPSRIKCALLPLEVLKKVRKPPASKASGNGELIPKFQTK